MQYLSFAFLATRDVWSFLPGCNIQLVSGHNQDCLSPWVLTLWPELDQAGNIPSRLRSAFSSSLTDARCLTSLITVPLWWQLPPIWLVPLLTSRRSINQHRFIQVRHMSTESKVSFCPYVWPKEAFSWMWDAFLTTFKTKIIQNQPLVCLCFVFLLIWVIIYLYSKAEIFGAPCSCLSRALNSYRG